MKFQRLYTVLALCVILISAAMPIGPAAAALDPTAVLRVSVAPDAGLNTAVQAAGFTITVANISRNQAKNLVVKDQLDPAAAWTVANDGCSISADGLLTCALGNLPGGESVQIHVSGGSPEMLCGGATVTAGADNALTAQVDSQSSRGDCTSLVSVEKTADASVVQPGEPISYTLAIKSYGSVTALNVALRDTLPNRPGLSWSIADPAPSECEIVSGELICNYPFIWSGAHKWVTITSPTSTATCGKVSNTASVSSSNERVGEAGNNVSTAEINVDCPAEVNVNVSKVAAESTVSAGGTIRYTLAVNNVGTAAAQNVTLTDTLPDSGLVWTIDAPAPAGCAIAEGVLTCNFGTLDAAASRSVHISAVAGAGSCGVVKNTASVSAADEPVGNQDDNDASATVTVELPSGRKRECYQNGRARTS